MNGERGVWVFSENRNLMLELLGGGRRLANLRQTELVSVLLGSEIGDWAEKVRQYGADRVLLVNHPKLKYFLGETYTSVLFNLVVQKKPEILLVGATKNGKELASRVAAKLGTGCVPDCNQLGIDDRGQLIARRTVYGGYAMAIATFTKKPHVATVLPRVFEIPEPNGEQSEIAEVEMEPEEPQLEVVRIDKMNVGDTKIEEAKIVICGGRGIDKKEDLKLLEELAQLLNGKVGNTRPLAEDRKWFTEWIGLSGKKVKPTLYMGCGISGSFQHMAGMRDSKVIVAINRDPEAALFEVADYIIVGDLKEIVPAIANTLKSIRGQRLKT